MCEQEHRNEVRLWLGKRRIVVRLRTWKSLGMPGRGSLWDRYLMVTRPLAERSQESLTVQDSLEGAPLGSEGILRG